MTSGFRRVRSDLLAWGSRSGTMRDVLSGQRSHWWGFLQGAGLEGPAVPAGGVPGVFGLCSSAGALQTTGP